MLEYLFWIRQYLHEEARRSVKWRAMVSAAAGLWEGHTHNLLFSLDQGIKRRENEVNILCLV
jgi:hypothetical protein